ncbi:MAG TPA: NRDE family protein, partial [Burkholderiales bacterium]
MCLIVLGWRALPDHPLIVAANRDEFHARPASAAAFWPEQPAILAGRDLQAKGTWMGVSRSGRFAAVTNFRGATEPSAAHSRGSLVTGFLQGESAPETYLKGLQGNRYSGFNLLVCDGKELWSMSNRDGPPRRLEPGIYGLGNTLLDAPEVDRPKERFEG